MGDETLEELLVQLKSYFEDMRHYKAYPDFWHRPVDKDVVLSAEIERELEKLRKPC